MLVRKVVGNWTRSRDGQPIFFMTALVDAQLGEEEVTLKVLFSYRKKGDKPKLLSVKAILGNKLVRQISLEAEGIAKAKKANSAAVALED